MSRPALQPSPIRRFPWWVYCVLFVLIVLFAAAPVFSMSFSAAIADENGCRVNMTGMQPCMIDGKDWSPLLLTTAQLGITVLFTAPLGMGALIVWCITLFIHRRAWGRASKAAP